jgi:hypothetical protein
MLCWATTASSCVDDRRSLTVRVVSSVQAELRLRYIEARLFEGARPCSPADSEVLDTAARAVVRADQEALSSRAGLSLRAFEGLRPGVYTLLAQFREPGDGPTVDSGPLLASRCVVLTLSGDRVVRVALTAECLGVACPSPDGDPRYTECLNGRCVDPRCDEVDPATEPLCCDRSALGAACDDDPTICRADEDCGAPLSDCFAGRRCVEGACLEPTTDLCPAGRYCDVVTRQCEALPMEAADAGAPDAGSLDASMGPDAASIPMDAPATPDGFVAPDGFVSPDALVTPDARVTPDAFVPRDTGSDAAGSGARDAAALDAGPICTPAPETCNGLDDDCDGSVDERVCLYQLGVLAPSWARTSIDGADADAPPAGTTKLLAFDIELSRQAWILTPSTYHVLDLTSGEWISTGALLTRFPELASVGPLTFVFSSPAIDPLMDETEALTFIVDSGSTAWGTAVTYAIEPRRAEFTHQMTFELGPDGPLFVDYRAPSAASWLDRENRGGWASGDPRTWCPGSPSHCTRLGPYQVHIDLMGNVTVRDADCCFEWYERVDISSFPPFTRPGAPAFTAWRAAAFNNDTLYLIN